MSRCPEGGDVAGKEPSDNVRTIICPCRSAERIRAIIMEMGLFDPYRSTGGGAYVNFPVKFHSVQDEEEFLSRSREISKDIEIVQGPGTTKKRTIDLNPYEKIISILEGNIDRNVLHLVPSNYERIGDCCVLKLPQEIEVYHMVIAEAFKSVLSSRYVLNDTSGIRGELREPTFHVLIEPEDGEYDVIHREGSTRYILDPRRVMFSSGNIDERLTFPQRASSMLPPALEDGNHCEDEEVVVDMFAGIGYFSVPLAVKYGEGRRIFAVEKNPISYEYLKKTVNINRVNDVVIPIAGDNRKVLDHGIADRIIMGYVGGTVEFITRAFEIMKTEGAIIHFHDTVEIEKGPKGLFELLVDSLPVGYIASIVHSRVIKSFAPRIDHVVLDVRITRE